MEYFSDFFHSEMKGEMHYLFLKEKLKIDSIVLFLLFEIGPFWRADMMAVITAGLLENSKISHSVCLSVYAAVWSC